MTRFRTQGQAGNQTVRQTFSDADVTVNPPTTVLAQTGTMTTARTVTLPAASSVPSGHQLIIYDESDTNYYDQINFIEIVVEAAGADTLLNNLEQANDDVHMRDPAARYFISNGVDQWTVSSSFTRNPFQFIQHGRNLAVNSGIWTPQPFNTLSVDPWLMGDGFLDSAVTTTIAAASDGATLPQATINVADTTGFPSSGYLVIAGPPTVLNASFTNTDTIVTYTGTTATSFTGCTAAFRGLPSGGGIQYGQLATGQTVRIAYVEHEYPDPYLYNTIYVAAFESIDLTAWCSSRFRTIGGFFFALTTSHDRGINLAAGSGLRGQFHESIMQPGFDKGASFRLENYQNTGGTRRVVVDGIQSPILMQAWMSAR